MKIPKPPSADWAKLCISHKTKSVTRYVSLRRTNNGYTHADDFTTEDNKMKYRRFVFIESRVENDAILPA